MKERTKAAAEREPVFFEIWAGSLFRSLNVTGGFAEALRRVGYDPDHPARTYPASVFLAMADIVRQHLFPDLSPPEGYRQMGRRQLAGYFGTGVGKVISKALPLLGPERLIQGMESYAKAGNNFLKVKAFRAGDRHWGLAYRNACGIPPDFAAGGVEHTLDVARVPSREIFVAGSDVARGEFDLELTW